MVSNPSSVPLDYDSCWRRQYSLSISPSSCPPQLIQGASEGERNAPIVRGAVSSRTMTEEDSIAPANSMIREDGRWSPNVVV